MPFTCCRRRKLDWVFSRQNQCCAATLRWRDGDFVTVFIGFCPEMNGPLRCMVDDFQIFQVAKLRSDFAGGKARRRRPNTCNVHEKALNRRNGAVTPLSATVWGRSPVFCNRVVQDYGRHCRPFGTQFVQDDIRPASFGQTPISPTGVAWIGYPHFRRTSYQRIQSGLYIIVRAKVVINRHAQ